MAPSPDEGSPSYNDDDADMEMQLGAAPHNELWQLESEIRVRCSGMTQLELQKLRALSVPLADRVLEEWLQPEKVTAKVWLWQMVVDENRKSWVPGECVLVNSPMFTLCKARLLTHRVANQSSKPYNCYCLPETSLMPCGCKHKGRPRDEGDGYELTCQHCSLCLRCGKFCKRVAASRATACSCHPAGLVGQWRH